MRQCVFERKTAEMKSSSHRRKGVCQHVGSRGAPSVEMRLRCGWWPRPPSSRHCSSAFSTARLHPVLQEGHCEVHSSDTGSCALPPNRVFAEIIVLLRTFLHLPHPFIYTSIYLYQHGLLDVNTSVYNPYYCFKIVRLGHEQLCQSSDP